MVMFQNAQRYKEYAVRYCKEEEKIVKGFLGIKRKVKVETWEWSKNEKGNNAIFNFETASQLVEALQRQ